MKKKIRNLTTKDMPKCWDKIFKMNKALMILFTEDEDKFNRAKNTIPEEILDQEIEVEEDEI